MLILLIMLAAVGLVALAAQWLMARHYPPATTAARQMPAGCTPGCAEATPQCAVACHKHGARPSRVLYFEDEELDAYRGRKADSYTATEVEAFRQVLITLRPNEVAAWLGSLSQRRVALPAALTVEAGRLVTQKPTAP